jgi:glycosyltransferase involved in cell wall biosynthesis
MTRRIGIDGYNLAIPNGTGVATYGMTLARTLRSADYEITGVFGIDAGKDAAMREVLFFERLGSPSAPTPAQLARQRQRRLLKALRPVLSWDAQEVPLTTRVVRTNLEERLPRFDRIVTAPDLFATAYKHFRLYGRFARLRMPDPPAVMHWTYPVPVVLAGAANIYTIHDLVPLRLPYTTLDAKIAHRSLLAGCIAHADRIVTVSESSREDISTEFKLPLERIGNTYQASDVTEALASSEMEDALIVERTFGLKQRGYFIYYGAIEPKKNVGRLIEAYLASGTAAPLVLVGGRGWHSEAELRLLPPSAEEDTAHGREMAERVRRLDHLPRRLLLRLVRGARALLFPSIFEGFGLPVLEALQLGTPVLTSSTTSLPELTQDAAVLVDPYDVNAIGAAITRLDGDEALRLQLRRAGPAVAKRFTPERYRERLETLYEAAIRAHGSSRSH